MALHGLFLGQLTAESTEDFCSQVFIKMFITTITAVAELCTHFLERKRGWRRVWPRKKMNLERTFPRMPTGRGRGVQTCVLRCRDDNPGSTGGRFLEWSLQVHPTHSPEQEDSSLPPPGCKSSLIYLQRVSCLMDSHPIPRILKSLVK